MNNIVNFKETFSFTNLFNTPFLPKSNPMKTILFFQAILFTGILSMSTNPLQQNDCRVLIPEIAENYKGDCKNGLAHGQGVASGTDHYKGKFKEGLPHGRGTYTWEDGSIYKGRWREGERDGRGTYVKIVDNEEMISKGIWQADTFLRDRRTKEYSVGHVLNVDRYTIRKIDETPDRIMVFLQQRGSQNTNVRNFHFLMDGDGERYFMGGQIGYQNVKFPARCQITYETPDIFENVVYRVRMEVTINEPGDWLITLHN